MASDAGRESKDAIHAAIKSWAEEIDGSKKIAAGVAAAALKDLAEAYAWLEYPAQPHS